MQIIKDFSIRDKTLQFAKENGTIDSRETKRECLKETMSEELRKKEESDAPSSVGPEDIKYLWEEYKLLQGKVDKIGAFRFQVKNWVVGLASTAAILAYNAELCFLILVFPLLTVVAFWILEMNQINDRNAFNRRIRFLEDEIRKRSTEAFSKKRKINYSHIKDLSNLRPASPTDAIYLNYLHTQRQKYWGWCLENHHHFLYCIVAGLVLAVMLASGIRGCSTQEETKTETSSIQIATPIHVKLSGDIETEVSNMRDQAVLEKEVNELRKEFRKVGELISGVSDEVKDLSIEVGKVKKQLDTPPKKKADPKPMGNPSKTESGSAQRKGANAVN